MRREERGPLTLIINKTILKRLMRMISNKGSREKGPRHINPEMRDFQVRQRRGRKKDQGSVQLVDYD